MKKEHNANRVIFIKIYLFKNSRIEMDKNNENKDEYLAINLEFSKKYNSEKSEEKIRRFWEENKIYKFNENTSKTIFSIDTPPPTLSGRMHIGHAFSFSQQDFIARFKRMNGYEVFYPFGTDDNGLATEKLVQKKEKVDLRKVNREDAIKIVLNFLKKERPDFIEDWKKIGMSCDFDISYSTIDKHSQKISQNSFLELVEKGFIERKKGPVMWDRKFQTAIAQAELEDVTRKAYLNYVKAKVVGSEGTYLIYATTRPELCFAVVGMSVQDSGNYVKLKVGNEFWICGKEQYEEKLGDFNGKIVEELKGEDLIGEKVIIPIVNRTVEISHDEAVKADFGTGIAYFCTYGGQEDIEWSMRHNVKPIELIDIYGKLNSLGGKYEGLLAENARKEIINDMEKDGSLIKKEEKEQVVNVGERSGVEVEFIVSNQWYVKYLDKKEFFWERAQRFNWYPEFMKSRIENWIKGLNWNWGFSRQRHYGIPIPVWYCKKCNKIHYAKKEQLPIDPRSTKPDFVCECGSKEFIPETDVFDTWFTSASTPEISTTLIKNKKLRKKLFPMSLRPQAHDIINFWLFYTMAKNNLQYGVNPFSDVIISGWVLAPDGTKMSKSKGNGISPQEQMKKYSADAIRFAASSTKLGFDQPFQEKELKTGYGIVNKIYNANKFASMLLKDFKKEDRKIHFKDLKTIDKWILSKLETTITNATSAFERYDYAKARSEFENFFMKNVADNYIEIVKERLWKPEKFGFQETKKAQKTLYYVLYSSLKGFAPFIPYITEEVYQILYRKYENEISIHKTNWPKNNDEFKDENIEKLGDELISIISAVRKYKSEKNVSMKEGLNYLNINCSKKLKDFIIDSIDDIKAVTGAEEINFVKKEETDIEIEKTKISIKLELKKNQN